MDTIIIGKLREFLGSQARSPQHYLDFTWSDEEWSRGCYTAIMPNGAWTSVGKTLLEPCGNIHWGWHRNFGCMEWLHGRSGARWGAGCGGDYWLILPTDFQR